MVETGGAAGTAADGAAPPDEPGWVVVMIGMPLLGPLVVTGQILRSALVRGAGDLGPAPTVAGWAVLVMPLVGWRLAVWRWARPGDRVARFVAVTFIVVAIALLAATTTAWLSTGTTGHRAGGSGVEDTRRWVTEPLTRDAVRHPVIVAVLLVTLLAVAGWWARRRSDGTALTAIWLATAATCFAWLPMVVFWQLGNGLASHSPSMPTVAVLWALPLVAHATAPILAVLAGTLLVRPPAGHRAPSRPPRRDARSGGGR